jgi:hypothetical protein
MTDEITQDEKRKILKDTLLGRAEADADLAAGGRFKKEVETRVTGVPQYPQIPSGPWAGAYPVPNDPATDQLGFPIDAQEPTGTPAEIEASLKASAPDKGLKQGE